MFTTSEGDTFASIARKVYGSEGDADRIARANPGAVEPLSSGISLIIPTQPNAPRNVLSNAPAATPNEVAVLIDGQRFRFWESVRITRSIDSFDTVDFVAPFSVDLPGFKDTFRPFSFKKLEVTVGGAPLFTGTMINIEPDITPARKAISVGGYSLPGVLNDCTSPASSFPIEFNGQDLKGIADQILKPFGLGLQFDVEPGPVFERVASDPNEKVLGFLAALARQRDLVISNTPEGDLLFLQSVEPGQPVATLIQGRSPLMGVESTFNAQGYYSHITGIKPTTVGAKGPQFTIKNPHLLDAIRPFTFNAPDTEDGELKKAVEAKAGRMFGNVASYTVEVNTWRDLSGELWAPNTTIRVVAPDAMIYTEFEFIIRSVELSRDSKSETARLGLVIPGAFSGQLPEVLPWDG